MADVPKPSSPVASGKAVPPLYQAQRRLYPFRNEMTLPAWSHARHAASARMGSYLQQYRQGSPEHRSHLADCIRGEALAQGHDMLQASTLLVKAVQAAAPAGPPPPPATEYPPGPPNPRDPEHLQGLDQLAIVSWFHKKGGSQTPLTPPGTPDSDIPDPVGPSEAMMVRKVWLGWVDVMLLGSD